MKIFRSSFAFRILTFLVVATAFSPGSRLEASQGTTGDAGQEWSSSEDYSASSSSDDAEDYTFSEEITVSLVSVAARVIDPSGSPIKDLEASDLEATLGGEPVDIVGVDWYDFGDGAPPPATDGLPSADPFLPRDVEPEPSPPRHLVIVMQIGSHMVVTLEKTHLWGHLKSLGGLEELLQDLRPTDRVALVSYDSRFKLWHDFTSDHRAVADRLYDAVGFGEPLPPEMPPVGQPSLARQLPEARMRRVTSAAGAADLLAEALRDVDGFKDIIWVGWGFGRRSAAAVRSMQEQGTVVSVLDVSQSDFHLLEGGLKSMAAATGGTYDKLFRWPKRSLDRLRRTLSGHFILTLDLSDAELHGKLRIKLAGRPGEVLLKPQRFRSGSGS